MEGCYTNVLRPTLLRRWGEYRIGLVRLFESRQGMSIVVELDLRSRMFVIAGEMVIDS